MTAHVFQESDDTVYVRDDGGLVGVARWDAHSGWQVFASTRNAWDPDEFVDLGVFGSREAALAELGVCE